MEIITLKIELSASDELMAALYAIADGIKREPVKTKLPVQSESYSKEDITNRCKELIAAGMRDPMKVLFRQMGVTKGSEIPGDYYDEFMNQTNKILTNTQKK